MAIFKKISKANREYYNDIFRAISLVAQLGIAMIINIFVFFFIGLWIAKKIGFTPVIIGVCILIGVVSGVFSCYQLVKKNERKK